MSRIGWRMFGGVDAFQGGLRPTGEANVETKDGCRLDCDHNSLRRRGWRFIRGGDGSHQDHTQHRLAAVEDGSATRNNLDHFVGNQRSIRSWC